MASISNRSDQEFAEAAHRWKLEQLYVDLSAAKGKGLTKVEKQYLRGLLCYHSPTEIAARLHVANDTVRNYLSKGLYRYIEEVLARHIGGEVRVKDWSRVPQLLEQAGYTLQSDIPLPPAVTAIPTVSSHRAVSCQGLPDVGVFYGRTEELSTLRSWILQDQCRLVILYGLGGIGKTALAAKLVESIQNQFEVVVWRSLRSPSSMNGMLTDLLTSLDPGCSIPDSQDSQVLQLMEYLHKHRCLLVFEDIQLLLQSGELAGQYQPGYEAYGDILRRIGHEAHQSCVMLTGWEKPRELSLMEGLNRPVRSLKLEGLGRAARQIFEEKGLDEEELWDKVIRLYLGNPLALYIIANTIQDLFGGCVSEFLGQNTVFFGDFTHHLHRQFNRLSPLEQSILIWLAQELHPITLAQLREDMQTDAPWSELLQALESLNRRSLIEKLKSEGETLFTLQPMIMRYIQRQHVK
ncbi:NB-ARC domain-containing protein [Leptolyngbya sp. FACHB-16]|uniref:NB-ARC domain-containing protein n=1 Tax=unclassified Leptolyngbya TaxID=2650499 RepID=UPI00168863FA|nr:NB-ARC domain-containing protein [Leptolyngbya sp. FACHB-16]MBD2158552.1 hypothetical protein [Leptolyngbya sp. FACHB-16]